MSCLAPENPFHCPEITAWEPAAASPALALGELHLWLLDTPNRPRPDTDPGALSSAERERARTFRHPDARDTYVHSRRAMRHILGGYLDMDPRDVRFRSGPHGKPYLDITGTDLRFNLTHSGRLCLLAVTRGPELGLDAEQIRERRGMEAIAARMFDDRQLRRLMSLPERERAPLFYFYWTRMEAMVKARGSGVFAGGIRMPPDMSHACFIPHPGFQACLAVDGLCPPVGDWRSLLFNPEAYGPRATM
jgi:4'-phosphopantetheinyl transferase